MVLVSSLKYQDKHNQMYGKLSTKRVVVVIQAALVHVLKVAHLAEFKERDGKDLL